MDETPLPLDQSYEQTGKAQREQKWLDWLRTFGASDRSICRFLELNPPVIPSRPMNENFAVICAWHNEEQRDKFLQGWGITTIPDYLILQQDKDKSGCAVTKNRALAEAMERHPRYICVIDDDCLPVTDFATSHNAEGNLTTASYGKMSMARFAALHIAACQPSPVEMFEVITDPPSRGTPFLNRTVTMPVAASTGFWQNVPDYDAPSQLVYGNKSMEFKRKTIFGRMCALSGMNVCFRSEFWPHFKFDETADRYDDIFGLYRLQQEAYRRGYCISTKGPDVWHSRQSNVWNNLRVEVENMERNETEWKRYLDCIPAYVHADYEV